MFDRFTGASKRTMHAARLAAVDLGHNYIAPAHILLGVLEVDPCAALDVLDSVGADRAELRDRARAMLADGAEGGEGGGSDSRRSLPFTAEAKRVIERTMEEAQELAHRTLPKQDGVSNSSLLSESALAGS
jgi:ATP-dependent Clp protease ATP-binding subunit ClpA